MGVKQYRCHREKITPLPKEWVVTWLFQNMYVERHLHVETDRFILLSKEGPLYMAAQISFTDMKLKIPASIMVV